MSAPFSYPVLQLLDEGCITSDMLSSADRTKSQRVILPLSEDPTWGMVMYVHPLKEGEITVGEELEMVDNE